MYKLPSQFDPTPRQALPSAGGGCSCSCCCCCVLTTIATPILTSMHFYKMVPAPAAVQEETAPAPTTEPASPDLADTSAPQLPDKPAVSDKQPPSRGLWATLGFFALPLAGWGGAMAGTMANAAFYNDALSLVVGVLVGVLIFCGIFSLLYDRFQRRPGKGFAVGLFSIFIMVLVGGIELLIWISFMK